MKTLEIDLMPTCGTTVNYISEIDLRNFKENKH